MSKRKMLIDFDMLIIVLHVSSFFSMFSLRPCFYEMYYYRSSLTEKVRLTGGAN